MIQFSQWWNSFKKAEGVKPITWVCGPERVLVDEITMRIRMRLQPDPWNYSSLDAKEMSSREVWSEIEQQPISDKGFRLVQVRNVEHLKNPERIIDWIKNRSKNPRTILVLVSSEAGIPRVPYEDPKQKGKGDPAPYIEAFSGKGQVVECNPFTQSTAKHAVSWVQETTRIRSNVAGYLLDRANGNLRLVRDVCFKLSLFDTEITIPTINMLLREKPRDSFVDALLALDKKGALLALSELSEAEYSKTLGNLEYRLNQAGRIHELQMMHKDNGEIMKELQREYGGQVFYIQDLFPVAKHYTKNKIAELRKMLAMVDEAVQLNQRVGVMETIVSLW